MSDTPETEEAKRRAEWLHRHKAPKGWIVLTDSEVSILRTELAAIERERDEAREKLADALQEVDLRTLDFERVKAERDDLRERYESALKERDSWRVRAEEKWAMRRELEELLDVNQAAASDEQFKKGLNSLKEIIRQRDDLRERLNELLNRPALV